MNQVELVKLEMHDPNGNPESRRSSTVELTIENGKEKPANGSPAPTSAPATAAEPVIKTTVTQQKSHKKELVYNMRSWLQNKGLPIIFFLIWFAINLFLIIDTYQLYCDTPKYFYINQILGSSLCISRAGASVIFLNASLVLLPMCRGFLAYVRTIKSLKGILRRQFDHAKGFHVLVGYTIVVSAIIHTGGHLVNNYRFIRNYSYRFPELNFRKTNVGLTYATIFGTVPGLTGIILLLILFAMAITAIKTIRNQHFEVFWYTHHLYIVFYALYLGHGYGDIVKFQTNIDKHVPGCVYKGNATCSEAAKFTPKVPEAWKWVIAPLTLFVIDKLYRLIRRQGFVEVRKIILHEGQVMEIRMKKPGFHALPGQYIRIKCPDIAKFEWHPFTLTKVPTEMSDEIWVQIKVAGAWTEALSKKISPFVLENKAVTTRVGRSSIISLENGEIVTGGTRERAAILPSLKLKVEGPYGGPLQDVTRYRTVVCVGAGIGVTPFAATLNSLRDQVLQTRNLGKLEKIYFVWVCRSVLNFSWFVNILYDVYQVLEKAKKDMLVVKLFVTRGNKISEEDASLIAQKHQWQRTLIKYGRPKWQPELEEIARNHTRERIGVFFCGPQVAGAALNEACLTVEVNDNVFLYHKESLG